MSDEKKESVMPELVLTGDTVELGNWNTTWDGAVGPMLTPNYPNWFLNFSVPAGRTRWLGRRPKVRGVAMNPVDHPHGGGEGKTSGGRNPVSPWGQPTRGYKTRNNKRTDKFIVRRAKK